MSEPLQLSECPRCLQAFGSQDEVDRLRAEVERSRGVLEAIGQLTRSSRQADRAGSDLRAIRQICERETGMKFGELT